MYKRGIFFVFFFILQKKCGVEISKKFSYTIRVRRRKTLNSKEEIKMKLAKNSFDFGVMAENNRYICLDSNNCPEQTHLVLQIRLKNDCLQIEKAVEHGKFTFRGSGVFCDVKRVILRFSSSKNNKKSWLQVIPLTANNECVLPAPAQCIDLQYPSDCTSEIEGAVRLMLASNGHYMFYEALTVKNVAYQPVVIFLSDGATFRKLINVIFLEQQMRLLTPDAMLTSEDWKCLKRIVQKEERKNE